MDRSDAMQKMSDGGEPDRDMVLLQHDAKPYPAISLETDPQANLYSLFLNSLVTAQYVRNQRVVSPEGKLILDMGCGSGYTSLILARANPGAKIYCVDYSARSVEFARERLTYHGIEAEFQVLSIYDLPTIGLKFDYINCTDVLYLLPDALQGLQAMKAVLQPDGLIRANFHSLPNRFYILQAQQLFKFMGLMDDVLGESEIEMALSVIDALKDNVILKNMVWPNPQEVEISLRSNALLQGDRGFTIPEVFDLLRQSDLEFVSMLEWRKWNVMDLFKDPENLPPFLALSLPECSIEDQLQLVELLQPSNRLIDFWCGHPGQGLGQESLQDWEPEDWAQAKVYLHPQMRTDVFKDFLIDCITYQSIVDLSLYWSQFFSAPVVLDSTICSCLLPLWEGGQTVDTLVQRWLKVRPIDPITFEPVAEELAAKQIRTFLRDLEALSCIMVERFN